MSAPVITTERWGFSDRRGRGVWQCVTVQAVRTRVERIVPQAGEEHAFDVQHWKRTVDVYVSPSGRSVRIFVDGEEVGR